MLIVIVSLPLYFFPLPFYVLSFNFQKEYLFFFGGGVEPPDPPPMGARRGEQGGAVAPPGKFKKKKKFEKKMYKQNFLTCKRPLSYVMRRNFLTKGPHVMH